jgi:hypothetical protein
MAITKYDQFDFLIDIVPRDVHGFRGISRKVERLVGGAAVVTIWCLLYK